MMSRREVLIVIPARNEESTVGAVVADIRRLLDCDIVVVNDASEDRTREEAELAGATVLTLPLRLGAWGAVQTGLRYAIRNGYRYSVSMDADGQHHAESVPGLLETARETGSDVVIGAFPQRLSLAKRVAWSYFRIITRLSVHDFTSGLRVYGRRAMRTLITGEANLLDYQDIGVLILLRRRGLSIREVETVMSPRRAGISRVFSSWSKVVRYMLQTTVLCIARFGVGRHRPRRLSVDGSRA